MSSTTTDQVVRSFASDFAGTVVARGDADNDVARAVWNGSIDASPAPIARCRTTEDIVVVVTLTRNAGLPLAVRGWVGTAWPA